MFDVYFAELRRYRAGAAAFAGVHLVVLAALQKLLELTASPLGVHLTMLFLYLLAGYAFAAFQFGSYRQPSRWIWLLHRPLHRAHILAALVLAAVTLAALAVTLPQMIVLAAQQHYTARVIDTRHYIGALCLSLAALAGWLSGGWIMLHRSRWACLVVLLPLVLCLHMATAATVLVSWLICDVCLLVLLYTVFCPQRHVRPDVAATIPAALMLQVGFYIVLSWSGTWLLNLSQLVPGMQGPEYDRGAGRVYTDAMRLTVSDRLLAGLSTSTAPDAAAWRTALARSPGHAVGPIIRSVAVPGVISNPGVTVFMQGENKWTFSEDARRYRGVNTRTGVAVGWFGTGGIGSTGQFDTLPVPQRDNRGGRWMIDSHALYALEEGDRHLREVLHVDAGEWLDGTITWAGEKGVLLTNRRVILLKSAGSALALDGALALPVPFRDLGAVDVAHVADGTLVSLLSGARQYARGGPAQQGVYLFDATGATRAVGQRTLENEYPALYEHKSWWISPVLATLIALPDMLIDNGDIPDTRVSTEARPAFVWMAMIAATLLAGGGSVWWVRRAAMAPRARLLWCLASLICGIPALLALMVAAPLPLFIQRRATVPGNHLQPWTSS